MQRLHVILLTVLIMLGMVGCAGTTSVATKPASAASKEPSVLVESYQMGMGDMVSIYVWKNPDLSVDAPIRPDGMIAVPLIGDVQAAGREPEQLAEEIKVRLSNYIKAPNVTVILKGLQGHEFLSRIRVTGAVENSLSMVYRQGMTVLDAVLEAGSVTTFADGNRTRLHRRTEEGTDTYAIRLKDIMENGDMSTNILLMPGDVITIPERLF